MEGIKPSELHRRITAIIQEVTGCSATWDQHPEALRSSEIREIERRISAVTRYHLNQAIAEEEREGRYVR